MTFDFVRSHRNPELGYIAQRTGFSIPSNFQPHDDLTEIEAWVATGGVIEPADVPTIEELKPVYEAAVQAHLDAVAQAHGYDNVLTACSYAAAPNPFQEESLAFVSWRGAVWAAAFALFNQVAEGTIPLPTEEEAIAALPTFPLGSSQ